MRVVSAEEAVAMIPDGASIMVGGFMGVGTPERLLDELVRQKKSGLSLISNDAAIPGTGVAKLFEGAQVSRMIGTHIGLNPKAQQQMLGKQIAVDLIPQGTFVERIRAGGCGLGGVLTPTGVGTLVEEGKQKIEVNGKEFLLETALRADFALVHAFLADYLGNLAYALTARNFNPVMGWRPILSSLPRKTSFRLASSRPTMSSHLAPWLIISSRMGDPWMHKPSSPAVWRRSFDRAISSISASASRRWSRTTCPKG
jgi:acetate CoA/acetoacetate CoA-transferase alpha subunit